MTFNSIEFAVFLPLVFLVYHFVVNKNLRHQNLFIVAVSYLFYGWWDWRFLLLIALTSFCSWYSGVLIDKIRKENGTERKVKAAAAANIALNLGILAFFKYLNFFVSSLAKLFPSIEGDGLLINVILPVGISFYTFQALSYTIDVYKRKIEPTHDIVSFFAFVSFFPQLVAGPIERATNLLPQFQRERKFDYDTAVDGMRQILWGLFKKVAVADNCAVFVNEYFGDWQAQEGSMLLLGAVLFTFQIYGDFSGYSDIAIGTSKLFGIKLKKNFNVPFFSRDIAEFWRRWHISLTTWFRDYVYFPLGGSRCSKAKTVRNTFIIFLLSGLWHGANWTFVVWGAYNAALFMPLLLLGTNRKYRGTVAEGRLLPSVKESFQMLSTFFLITLGFIIFRSESIGDAWGYFIRMFTPATFDPLRCIHMLRITYLSTIAIMIFVEWLNRNEEHGLSLGRVKSPFVRYGIYLILAFMILLTSGDDLSQFIYFQF